jgi:hypothetical protein
MYRFIQPHPTFGRLFRRFFLRARLTAAALLSAALNGISKDSGVTAQLGMRFSLSIIGSVNVPEPYRLNKEAKLAFSHRSASS